MILILSGTSSSGKSTLSEQLQKRLGDGWLSFSMDTYLSMLGSKFMNLNPDNPDVCTPNSICYAQKHSDDTYEIITGELCNKLYATIPKVLALLSEQGFHIILDSFITSCDEHSFYKEQLQHYGLMFIYLHAPIEVISQREVARGDRLRGSALHWLNDFECESVFDLSFDTHAIPIMDIVETIMDKLKSLMLLQSH